MAYLDNVGEPGPKGTPTYTTGKNVDVGISSIDTVLLPWSKPVHCEFPNRERWEKKGDMIPMGMFRW